MVTAVTTMYSKLNITETGAWMPCLSLNWNHKFCLQNERYEKWHSSSSALYQMIGYCWIILLNGIFCPTYTVKCFHSMFEIFNLIAFVNNVDQFFGNLRLWTLTIKYIQAIKLSTLNILYSWCRLKSFTAFRHSFAEWMGQLKGSFKMEHLKF